MIKSIMFLTMSFIVSLASAQTESVTIATDSIAIYIMTNSDPSDSVTSSEDLVLTRKMKIVEGVASFYSKSLNGTRTATGETFLQVRLTAASNNFPLNTWVRVTNLQNDKSVIVRINDRMAKRMAKKGRVVDLSTTAAEKLDFIHRGITKVRVEEVLKGTTK